MAIEKTNATADTWTIERGRAEAVLLGEVGSSVHGTGTGSDDRDEMGVCIEPPEYVIGLRRFEQFTWRTQPDGVRSGPGDLDQVIYGLRKYCSLALKGNPSVLLLLFTPESTLVRHEAAGWALRANADLFASKKAGKAFLGYMMRQRERLLGIRGQTNVKRPELVDRYGFDTKFAGHMIRLGYQGVDYLATGRFPIPMPEYQRAIILGVRNGHYPIGQVLELGAELESQLEEGLRQSGLPDLPNYDAVNELLIDLYSAAWPVRATAYA